MAKKIIMLVIVIVMALVTTSNVASAKTSDLAKAKAWASAHYKGKVVKVVDFGKLPKNRIGVVYIVKLKTVSKGGHKGKVKGTKYTVGYPKKVKRGKKVNMYLIYNPKTNASDDVIAVVACGKIW